jgi:maleate isomerase
VLGQRQRFGVIIPSTNTVVEHDFTMIRPDEVTFHYGRMFLPRPNLGSDEDFLDLIDQIRDSIGTAVRDVMTCNPTAMLMGMSAETFWGGVEGNAAFIERISAAAGGLPVSTGASSCRAALERYGVHRISVFSPYQPVADVQVSTYFTEAGFDVAHVTGLRCASATAISEVLPEQLEDVVAELDGDDVEAIVQVGTNLSFVRQAADLEQRLGKPVIAINAATLWYGLRMNGIEDRVDGFGSLLRDH